MCGIVAAVSENNIVELLIEGLKRLEYRGYDSAGIAVVDAKQELVRVRCLGKVQELENEVERKHHNLVANTGIAHTRWATHGSPSEINAHPHVSGSIVVVHNGIIENHEVLRTFLKAQGYEFKSQTDTEVVAHLVNFFKYNPNRLAKEFGAHALAKLENAFAEQLQASELDLLTAVKMTVCVIEGAYGLAIMDVNHPEAIVGARLGSPLVVGYGENGNYLASDQLALIDKTRRFTFLEEGDVVLLEKDKVQIYFDGKEVEREIVNSTMQVGQIDKGDFDSFMLKEIFEQPQAIIDSIEGRIVADHVLTNAIGPKAQELLEKVEHVQIIACGTSYHSGLVAKYWLEDFAGISCDVEIASEYRYRKTVTRPNSLIITMSQSGETADTLAALRKAKASGFLGSMTICNVPSSSIVRESDLSYITRCGIEIGVASTKAFTAQLVLLLMFTSALARVKGTLTPELSKRIVEGIATLPRHIENYLQNHEQVRELAQKLVNKESCIYLGRDTMYPIAKEGDLKLKELSYVHSEAFAGGELKHGPLALVDHNMPVIALAPSDSLVDKMKSNIEEVLSRGGQTFVFSDDANLLTPRENLEIIPMPKIEPIVAPILYVVPLQLLAYYLAKAKGCDVDKPRNLAKSVTVE
ncbi:glutamine--fructose-6-phosphate transaminase (isomerizing) [Psittacicella melopsittaci]|uniref:Glutamine--fructose-6-phosphate aminotransferase [isomerizing] n=1 Tax=Psittacicella melopsittaci TaxID=2028576 RepID=A0A3A1Y7M7_9GAMM|nr:glutamine--fructose-6-phosphate transaminase (isomerizing) [Psittacicella melopsittaci]RIY33260.1 glutamine--fructose-6-phosphate transaminase (isomerizing) [Psittacicella melopsittaci]